MSLHNDVTERFKQHYHKELVGKEILYNGREGIVGAICLHPNGIDLYGAIWWDTDIEGMEVPLDNHDDSIEDLCMNDCYDYLGLSDIRNNLK